jgi:hypothetical protein
MRIVKVGVLIGLASVLGFAGDWSGALVNAGCYANKESNTRPRDTEQNVDRNRDLEVWYCTPNAKTKSFAVVQHNGISLKLDTAGNQKAAELVRQTGKKALYEVQVTGNQTNKNTVAVNSISLAETARR